MQIYCEISSRVWKLKGTEYNDYLFPIDLAIKNRGKL
jgi:hypothetical protein